MNIQNWKIFNKSGSPLNWLPSPMLPITFLSPTGKDAAGYLITNPSTFVTTTEITNGGTLYDNNDVSLWYDYALNGSTSSFDATITYQQIPVFGSQYDLSNGSNVFYTNSISNLSFAPYTTADIKYGSLYNWWAANNASPIANVGWKVPTNPDFAWLKTYLNTNQGGKLKEDTVLWNAPNTGATNEVGFNARPGSVRGYTGVFGAIFGALGIGAYFWAYGQSTYNASEGNRAYLRYDTSVFSVGEFGTDKREGMSLRLMKDGSSSYSHGHIGTYTGNDGNIYNTITIGTQEWTSENLIETKYRDGSTIPNVTVNASWAGLSSGAYAYYANSSSNAYTLTSHPGYLPDTFIYPSVTFASAVFLKPISIGLVETEHLYIFEEELADYIRPYDTENSILYFEMVGDDEEIQFFDINEDKVEINWSTVVGFDCSVFSQGSPIQLNIGFKSNFEGVFERTIRIYHLVGDILYTLGEIVVNAEAVGEDERFRTLLGNFGLPDPKDMKDIFKETDINEDLPDWDVLNYKSKQMILEHDKIMPYVGTYRGLINAIKWLGYDDVYIKEWFLNVQDHTKLAILVSYDAKDRLQTMLQFDAAQRKTLKKLNQLSLNYCITRDTGTYDIWGTPETENCYTYNLKEVFIKLLGLKRWLELNIIGVNCRITDLTGEGVYYERIQNIIYETDNIGYDFTLEQTLTPYSPDEMSELVRGDASIRLTFLELTQTKIADLPWTFEQMAEYAWSPTDTCVNNHYELDSSTYLADPSSFVLVGATFAYPFVNIQDIGWKLSLENTNSAVIGNNLVTNPLFILENEIRYYNIFDSSSVFFDSSTDLLIQLEKAYLRDASNDVWVDSIAYSIYPMADTSSGNYAMESSTGAITFFDDYVSFFPNALSKLEYAVDSNYKVPLLSMYNFSATSTTGVDVSFGQKAYILDILDGKIYMNAGNIMGSQDSTKTYLNFNYDTSLDEQQITSNVVMQSPRMELWRVDPSIYYWGDPSGLTGGDASSLIVDNSIYTMHVNHIGNYNIELYAWNGWNVLFHNIGRETYPVFIKSPTIYTLIDDECNISCSSTYLTVTEVSTLISLNRLPIYDRLVPLQGLSVLVDPSKGPYINVPSITYFQDVPEPNSINKFFNLTERCISITGTNTIIDEDFQSFYVDDDVALITFDKGKYSFISENEYLISSITSLGGTLYDVEMFSYISEVIDASTEVYIQNISERATSNSMNLNGKYVTTIVSGLYAPYQFLVGQNVAVMINNVSTGYAWGATYRVTDVSGYVHTFDAEIPAYFLDASIYQISLKHAFTTYAEMQMKTLSATETNNEFNVYLNDSRCQEYYLDNTFTMVNILFDQDVVNANWYDTSRNLVNSNFWYHSTPINTDASTLVILKAMYDPSTYLLNQKNIWQVINHDTSTVLFKVFNDVVPYIYNETGTYDVEVTSYDSFGNSITKKYEGLINVIDSLVKSYSIPDIPDIPDIIPIIRYVGIVYPSYSRAMYAMPERQWTGVFPYTFTLNSLSINGVEYSSGETLTIPNLGSLLTGYGFDGSVYVTNIVDWLNNIIPTETNLTFYDNMSVFDMPINSSFYINITNDHSVPTYTWDPSGMYLSGYPTPMNEYVPL